MEDPKNTPKAKGIRTAYQTIASTVVTFVTGLVALPEVRTYTSDFIQTQGAAALFVVLGSLGVSAGLISFAQNRIGK